jgi:drug/metabolite transporter (DMT)-like permease
MAKSRNPRNSAFVFAHTARNCTVRLRGKVAEFHIMNSQSSPGLKIPCASGALAHPTVYSAAMKTHSLRADVVLLIAAVLWGAAFVAQRVAMRYMGPLTFNGLRFALGALALAAVVVGRRSSHSIAGHSSAKPTLAVELGVYLVGGITAGLVLFAGASLQQIGLVYTTAGKAGFITGLYLPLVPILALFLGRRTGCATWLGVALAVIGLYLLSVKAGTFEIERGDALVIACAVVWAVHVLIVAHLAPRLEPLTFGLVQFSTVAVVSLAVACAFEPVARADLRGGALALLYGGLISVGIAYTLQIVGQREAPAGHAALILSLEAVFAALAGGLLLGEQLGPRELAGAGLMLCAMLVSQLPRVRSAVAAPPVASAPRSVGPPWPT